MIGAKIIYRTISDNSVNDAVYLNEEGNKVVATHAILTSSNGEPISNINPLPTSSGSGGSSDIQGKQVEGVTSTANPVLIGAIDEDANLKALRITNDGKLLTNAEGGASVGGGNSTYSNLQKDFTAVAIVGTKTIVLSNLIITITSINISSAIIKKYNTSTGIVEQLDMSAYTFVNNGGGTYTITIINTVNFIANDTINVAFVGKDKYADQYNASNYVQVLNTPLQLEPTQWLNTTNLAAGTTYQPSTNGEIQEGSGVAIYIRLVAGTNNTATLTIEGLEDASNTSTPVLSYDITESCIVMGLDKTLTTALIQSTYSVKTTSLPSFVVAAGQTLACSIALPNYTYTRLRVKIVTTNTGTATNTLIVSKQNKPIGN